MALRIRYEHQKTHQTAVGGFGNIKKGILEKAWNPCFI